MAMEKTWHQKQLYGLFKRQTDEISHENTSAYLRKYNLRKENEYILLQRK